MKYLSPSEAGLVLNPPRSQQMVINYMNDGATSEGGNNVTLRHIKVNGKYSTTKEWIDLFYEELQN